MRTSNDRIVSRLSRRGVTLVLCGTFLLGVLVRLLDVNRPINGTTWDFYRECDIGGIARNFYHEGMNILYPRIDWRGDGPGYVESEFPLYAWCTAALYHVFGYHEQIARIISYVLSLGSLLVFYLLAAKILPLKGALLASVFFALNPLSVKLASAIYAEPMMFIFYIAAAYCFIEWIETSKRHCYWIAMAATVLAVLTKLPALHIGILFALLCFDRFGVRALFKKEILVFAAVSLSIPAAWYIHAHALWTDYGNSLGMSDEAFIRIASLHSRTTALSTLKSLAAIEVSNIWMPSGALLGLMGLYRMITKKELTRYRAIVYWLAALLVYYLVSSGTTGEDWAHYYHIVSLPAAALLVGSSILYLDGLSLNRKVFNRMCVSLMAIGTLEVAAVLVFRAGLQHAFRRALAAGFLLIGIGLTSRIPGLVAFNDHEKAATTPKMTRVYRSLFFALLIGMIGASPLFEMSGIKHNMHPSYMVESYDCALAFEKHIAENSLIVASGDPSTDQYGIQRASNAPQMFFWTNRKGFSLRDSEQSIARLDELKSRGARYFIADGERVATRAGFEMALAKQYVLVSRCSRYSLFEL
jgi:hypothetical protein